ncbi:Zinc finger C-x8-C-x5-C-x3-H type family protein, putative isoform 1 [Hibiscus syriacus]|uniref:Zinc finger C-x8-C-x5-C-x3-H type family protein, putative isoform 1 n=1 Tax=Hibiscus syriacus TaxID=106335 RepID=A0A6A3A1K3_HIBSY|nr:Zinc finger C-x8-C-x5-C-x3-H type family protein, putative isoform 1 [Hibiscus syriacus]
MLAAPAATTRTRIHVGGLGQSVSSDDLRKIFSAVGTVEGMDIVRTKSRSFAYVDILPSSSHSISKHFSMHLRNLPGTTALQEVAKPVGEDALQSSARNHSNIKEEYTASGVGKERDSIESILKSNHETIDADKDASVRAVENLSNSEPDKGFGVDTSTGESCSFMRSSASLKEWAKTKASLKGSRKKKN